MHRVDPCLHQKWIYRGTMFLVTATGDIVIIVVPTGCSPATRPRGRYHYHVNHPIHSKSESPQLKNCNLPNFDVMIKLFEDKMA